MDAIRKQAMKLREQLSKQQQLLEKVEATTKCFFFATEFLAPKGTFVTKMKKMRNGMPTSKTSKQEPEKMKLAVQTNDDDDATEEEDKIVEKSKGKGRAKSKGEEGGKAAKTILNGAVKNGRGKFNDTSTNKNRKKELTCKDESGDASINTKRKKREFPTREEISKARSCGSHKYLNMKTQKQNLGPLNLMSRS